MKYSRRAVVIGLAGAAATTGGVSQSLFMSADDIEGKLRPIGRGRHNVHLASATYDDWAIQKGSFFTLDTGDVVKLVDVQAFPDYPGRPNNLRPGAFLNTFEVQQGARPTVERIYRLAHKEGGEFDLFLNLASGNEDHLLAVLG